MPTDDNGIRQCTDIYNCSAINPCWMLLRQSWTIVDFLRKLLNAIDFTIGFTSREFIQILTTLKVLAATAAERAAVRKTGRADNIVTC